MSWRSPNSSARFALTRPGQSDVLVSLAAAFRGVAMGCGWRRLSTANERPFQFLCAPLARGFCHIRVEWREEREAEDRGVEAERHQQASAQLSAGRRVRPSLSISPLSCGSSTSRPSSGSVTSVCDPGIGPGSSLPVAWQIHAAAPALSSSVCANFRISDSRPASFERQRISHRHSSRDLLQQADAPVQRRQGAPSAATGCQLVVVSFLTSLIGIPSALATPSP